MSCLDKASQSHTPLTSRGLCMAVCKSAQSWDSFTLNWESCWNLISPVFIRHIGSLAAIGLHFHYVRTQLRAIESPDCEYRLVLSRSTFQVPRKAVLIPHNILSKFDKVSLNALEANLKALTRCIDRYIDVQNVTVMVHPTRPGLRRAESLPADQLTRINWPLMCLFHSDATFTVFGPPLRKFGDQCLVIVSGVPLVGWIVDTEGQNLNGYPSSSMTSRAAQQWSIQPPSSRRRTFQYP